MSRGWLLSMLALAACKYTPPDPATPGDGDLPTDSDGQVIDPDGPDGDGPPVPWLQPYLHRKRITLLDARIDDTGGALDNFPVLIALDDEDLGAATVMPDMAFTTEDEMTLLDSEIERFSGDRLEAWVRMPTLSASADTVIYMYYGNANPPNTNPQGVWSEQYRAVWHMAQDPAGATQDSTAGNHDGTSAGNVASTDGAIGRGLSFDGTGDFLDFAQLDVGASFTISAWVTLGTAGAGIKTVMSNTIVGGNQDGFRFFVNTSGAADGRLLFETGNGMGSTLCRTDQNRVQVNTPTRIDAVIDRAQGTCDLLVNAVDRTDPNNDNVLTDFETNLDFEIGRMKNGVEWNGVIDEVTIAAVERPAGWITTTFNNQASPETFFVVGPQEDRP